MTPDIGSRTSKSLLGNPRFVKGNPGGPGRPKGSKNIIKKIAVCADFMEKEGWKLMIGIARDKTSKHQLGALQSLAAYGYGKPAESVEFSGAVEAKSLADLLSATSFEKAESSGDA